MFDDDDDDNDDDRKMVAQPKHISAHRPSSPSSSSSSTVSYPTTITKKEEMPGQVIDTNRSIPTRFLNLNVSVQTQIHLEDRYDLGCDYVIKVQDVLSRGSFMTKSGSGGFPQQPSKKKHHAHPGNRRLLVVIEMYRNEYETASNQARAAKTNIIRHIVDIVRESGGHFVKYDEKTGMWYDIGNFRARYKVRMLFRQARIHHHLYNDIGSSSFNDIFQSDCDDKNNTTSAAAESETTTTATNDMMSNVDLINDNTKTATIVAKIPSKQQSTAFSMHHQLSYWYEDDDANLLMMKPPPSSIPGQQQQQMHNPNKISSGHSFSFDHNKNENHNMVAYNDNNEEEDLNQIRLPYLDAVRSFHPFMTMIDKEAGVPIQPVQQQLPYHAILPSSQRQRKVERFVTAPEDIPIIMNPIRINNDSTDNNIEMTDDDDDDAIMETEDFFHLIHTTPFFSKERHPP